MNKKQKITAAACIVAVSSVNAGTMFEELKVTVDGEWKTLYVAAENWTKNLETSDTRITYKETSRMYLTTVPYIDPTKYFKPNMLGGVFEYDVTMDKAYCNTVQHIYTVLMPDNDNKDDKFRYCDGYGYAQRWCPEFDIMQANQFGFQVSASGCYGSDGIFQSNCYKEASCISDVLTGSDENRYGPGLDYTINTLQTFHVKTEFHEKNGQFVGYTTTLTQNSNTVVMSSGDCPYLNFFSQDLTQMVFVLALWRAWGMDWMQHGACQGSDKGDEVSFSQFENLVFTTGPHQ